MHRYLPIAALILILLTLVPIAEATWTTNANVPASFRPNRAVTFTYTASSSAGTDLAAQWSIDLRTCQDTDANTYCTIGEPHFVDHGTKILNVLGGQSGSVSWTISLDKPEGTYRYHFHARCASTPCANDPGSGAHNKTGAFQLRYTDTWTRTILATDPTTVGSTQTIEYRLRSTSSDDRDLLGTARLHSTPEGESERDHGIKPIGVFATQTQTLTWTGIDFPNVGTQRLRVNDSTGPDAALDVTVRGVHIHVHQPRSTYDAGGTFSLYFTLEGHDPHALPVANNDIRLTIKNGSFAVATATARTDANGLAYANVSTADDVQSLTWTATTSGTWLGVNFDLSESGIVHFTAPDHDALAENISAIRANLSEIQLKGVHLDEIGTHNTWLLVLRAAGAVAGLVLLMLLIVQVAARV